MLMDSCSKMLLKALKFVGQTLLFYAKGVVVAEADVCKVPVPQFCNAVFLLSSRRQIHSSSLTEQGSFKTGYVSETVATHVTGSLPTSELL